MIEAEKKRLETVSNLDREEVETLTKLGLPPGWQIQRSIS